MATWSLSGSQVCIMEMTGCAKAGCGVRDWLLCCHLTFSLMNQLLILCNTAMAYKQSQSNCWRLQQDRDVRP